MTSAERSLRLHLGCGRRYIPGFVHVDLADFPHIDHRHDISTLPMFSDGSADLIYVCHAFEYFDRVQAPAVLGEWRRALRVGGVLRLAVPDLEALARIYLKTGDLGLILGPVYGRIVIATPGGEQVAHHRTGYDLASLTEVLVSAGFRDVRRYDWRETEHADIDDFSQAYIPHMDKQHGTLISLNVEATK
jgi:predicted SAM-dependent methyltransferase